LEEVGIQKWNWEGEKQIIIFFFEHEDV
jgi:hypothetical protein